MIKKKNKNKYIEFKLPKEIVQLLDSDCFMSDIATDENRFRIKFQSRKKRDNRKIVFDFGESVEDYILRFKGKPRDNNLKRKKEKTFFVEIEDSEYLQKIDKESDGTFLSKNPTFRHYRVGNVKMYADIISGSKPTVYIEVPKIIKTTDDLDKDKEKKLKKTRNISENEIITRHGRVKLGRTKDGETIVLRSFSSELPGNKPTLEVHRRNGRFVKIRYDD